MHRVLEHIDRHLDQELNLRALARVAHFSAFHFHRIFFSWTGETLGDYLWEAMLREWLPGSGMQLDARAFLEYYPTDAAFDPKTGVFTCDIAIPVAPL